VAGGQWSAGIAINNDGAADVLIASTSISGFAQGIVTGNITDLRVTGCFIKDIAGQHGVYVASASRYAIVGNIIDNANLEGVKVQIGTTSSPDAVDGVVSGNVISRCGSHGIHLTNTAGGTPRHRRVAVTGNTVTTDTGATGDGINVDYADDVTIVGNRVSGGRNGILIASANAVTVSTNRASACTDRGIGIVSTTDFDVLNNRVKDVATANNASTEFGIHLDGTTTADGRVNGNKVTESGTNMRYALYVGPNTTAANQATMTFVDNVLTGATDYGARMVTAATTLRFHGNVLAGTTGPILTPPTNYAANADTSGATLAALETEVNELKATLRGIGVLAP
jgi:parallel beta-helix repeat protein